MQSGFCTNCGQPLAAGAAFCPSCGTRVEAQTANSVPPSTPPYVPGSNPPGSFTPVISPAQGNQQKQSRGWIGWVVGCLVAFLAVVAVLIGLLVFGLLTHHLVLFAIGLGGIVLLLFVGAIIEHQIRRLYRRAKYGLERDIGFGSRPYDDRPAYRARPYHEQPRFSLFRFLFTLAFIAAALYGGLYLYYTQQFVGEWSGVLKIGTAQQGVLANLQISLPLHGPTNPSLSDLPSLTFVQVQFKPTTAQPCKASQTSYQLSGTASRLDASNVAMTLNTGKETVQLLGSYQNSIFTLGGKNAQGQPVTLTLEKGIEQGGYRAACG